jgi:hypothetical protein
MTRHPITRTLLLLLRDARGRFTRIRATITADRPIRSRARRRPRPMLAAATQQAVDGLRGLGYSWAGIAARLGTTRQAAQQRWARQ